MPLPVRKFTKDTITAKGDSSLVLGFKCGSDELLKSKTEIYFWSGCDNKHKLFEKLGKEFSHCPLVNLRLKEDISGILDKTNRIGLVYLTQFFDDGGDFLYMVKGYKNLANFLKLTYSGRSYDDPCFATPTHLYKFEDLVNTGGLDCTKRECVSKTNTKGLQWKYLYGSAVNAWEQLKFHQEKYNVLAKKLSQPRPPVAEPSDTEEDTDSDISDDEDDFMDDEGNETSEGTQTEAE